MKIVNLDLKNKKNVIICLGILVVFVILIMLIFMFTKKSEVAKDINYIKSDIKNEKEAKTQDIPNISFNASLPIFMYHFVRDDTGDYMYPENMVKTSSLEEQFEALNKNGFESIFDNEIENLYMYNKPVMITFDDGWEDVFLVAFPLAKKYNIKINVFVITDYIGKEGYCSVDELKIMLDSKLVKIDSHTVTHPRLNTLDYKAQYQELSGSKSKLKELLNVDSDVICYPYGLRDDNTIKISKELGYKYGFDMLGGVFYTKTNTDMYKIPRIYVNRSMSLKNFLDYANKSSVNIN